MVCKYCGNKYRQQPEQCPTCGGRSFESELDSIMTTLPHGMGYWGMYQAPVVINLGKQESVYPMPGVQYVLQES